MNETFEIPKNGHMETLVKVLDRPKQIGGPCYDGMPNTALRSRRKLTERERLIININNGTLIP